MDHLTEYPTPGPVVDGLTAATRPALVIPAPRQQPPAEREPGAPLTGRHALVVGINYAPEPTGTAPYTTGMAEHLARQARSLTVLTGMPHYPTWRTDPAFRYRLRSSHRVTAAGGGTLTVTRARHYVPRSQNVLRRAGYELSFLGQVCGTRLERSPDLVVGVTPTLSGALGAAHLARRHGSRLLIVVQELIARAATQCGMPGGEYAARAAAALERHALRRADRVAVVSDAFRDQLHEYGIPDQRIATVPNWTHILPSRLGREECRRILGWPAERFTVVHTGNIGLKQDLGNLVEAARLCELSTSLEFVVIGDGSQRSAVEAHARGLTNIRFLDPLDATRYPQALAAADLLVVNERPGVADMSLPSKLTSYLSAGRPVVAAVAANGATAAELRRAGGAAVVVRPGDPTALVEAFLGLRADPRRRDLMGLAGQRYARAELRAPAVLDRLDDVIRECLG